MAGVTYVRYLYIPTSSSDAEFALAVSAFERSGGDVRRVCLAESVLEASGELAQDSVLAVYSVRSLGSMEAFVGALVALQERRIFVQSLKEPWVNEPIRDHAYCVEKFRKVMSVLQDKTEFIYEIK